eukprot:Hpha_TRINITY_DN31237_c0_g1::TRINITY_DN31237_c0_g1_i1::g.2443::m.2443
MGSSSSKEKEAKAAAPSAPSGAESADDEFYAAAARSFEKGGLSVTKPVTVQVVDKVNKEAREVSPLDLTDRQVEDLFMRRNVHTMAALLSMYLSVRLSKSLRTRAMGLGHNDMRTHVEGLGVFALCGSVVWHLQRGSQLLYYAEHVKRRRFAQANAAVFRKRRQILYHSYWFDPTKLQGVTH